MKKLILILALITAGYITSMAQSQVADSIVTEKTTEQHIADLDSLIEVIATKISQAENMQPKSHRSTFEREFGNSIIPLVAIVSSMSVPVLIVLIIFIFRYKNKKVQCELVAKALESGKDIPEGLFGPVRPDKDDSLIKKGITNICLGVGLGIFLWAITGEFGLGCIGFMIMFIGIGQVIIHNTQRPSQEQFINIQKNKTNGEPSSEFGNTELAIKKKSENQPEE